MRINRSPTFVRPVKVNYPEGEATTEETVTATFRVIPNDEFEAFDLTSAEGSVKAFERLIVDFDGLTEEDGKTPVACTPEIRAALLRDPIVSSAALRTYLEAIRAAARGN